MKLFFVTNNYPIESAPLGAYHIRDIALGMTRLGHQVTVLVHNNLKEFKSYTAQGVKIIEYPTTLFWTPRLYQGTEIIASLKKSFLAWIELFLSFLYSFALTAKHSKDCDVIHAFWYLPSGLTALLCNLFIKKPVVVTAFGAEFHLPQKFWVKCLLRTIHASADAVTANSRYLANKAEAYGLEVRKFHIIPTTVQLADFSDLNRSSGPKVVIGSFGRLIAGKRTADIIEAVSLLSKDDLGQIEIRIIGDGPEKVNLEALVQQKKLQGQSRFYGIVSREELLRLLKSMDIFVNPTMADEGMAGTNIEAMAMGICVVASNGYANDEVIQDQKTGFLFPPRDVKAISRILETLLKDRKRIAEIGRAASQYVHQHHDVKNATEEIVKIYKGVC